jgi:hypothetical protein
MVKTNNSKVVSNDEGGSLMNASGYEPQHLLRKNLDGEIYVVIYNKLNADSITLTVEETKSLFVCLQNVLK